MKPLPHGERLTTAGFACGAIVLAAGLVATLSKLGVVIASLLLTVAAIVATAGLAAARDPQRRLDVGIWVPIAAALPLSGIFYAIGLFIFDRLGRGFAGGLLIATAVVIATATTFATLQRHRPVRD